MIEAGYNPVFTLKTTFFPGYHTALVRRYSFCNSMIIKIFFLELWALSKNEEYVCDPWLFVSALKLIVCHLCSLVSCHREHPYNPFWYALVPHSLISYTTAVICCEIKREVSKLIFCQKFLWIGLPNYSLIRTRYVTTATNFKMVSRQRLWAKAIFKKFFTFFLLEFNERQDSLLLMELPMVSQFELFLNAESSEINE